MGIKFTKIFNKLAQILAENKKIGKNPKILKFNEI